MIKELNKHTFLDSAVFLNFRLSVGLDNSFERLMFEEMFYRSHYTQSSYTTYIALSVCIH